MDLRSARIRFAAAVALYLIWVAALAGLAAVSASRPAAAQVRPATAPVEIDSPGSP